MPLKSSESRISNTWWTHFGHISTDRRNVTRTWHGCTPSSERTFSRIQFVRRFTVTIPTFRRTIRRGAVFVAYLHFLRSCSFPLRRNYRYLAIIDRRVVFRTNQFTDCAKTSRLFTKAEGQQNDGQRRRSRDSPNLYSTRRDTKICNTRK